ncbi:hypothetical protein RCL1_007387 [Eukaryota sp. TZLM3-RCL]
MTAKQVCELPEIQEFHNFISTTSPEKLATKYHFWLLRRENQMLLATVDDQATRIAALEAAHAELKQMYADTVRDQALRISTLEAAQSKLVQQLSTRFGNLNLENRTLSKTVNDYSNSFSQFKTSLSEQVSGHQQRLAQHSVSLANLDNTLTQIVQELSSFRSVYSNQRDFITDLQSVVNTHGSSLDEVTTQLALLQSSSETVSPQSGGNSGDSVVPHRT